MHTKVINTGEFKDEMPEAYITSVCYRGAFFGYFITYQFAWWFPWFLWFAAAGKLYDPDLRGYFLLYYFVYVPAWILAWSLRDIVFRVPPMYPECNNSDFALPSVEFALLVQYYVMGFLHHAYFNIPTGWLQILRSLAVIIFMVGMFLWSGNWSIADMAVGFVIGTGMGFLFSYALYDFFVPRFPFFNVHPVARWLGTAFLANPRPDQLEKWGVI